MEIDKLQSILAAEIECSIFETHVQPAIEVARKVDSDERIPAAYMVRHKDFSDCESLWRTIELKFADKYKANEMYDMRPLYL